MLRNASLMGDGTFCEDLPGYLKDIPSKDCTKNSSNPETEYKE
jgi:hypothetical protein